MYAAPPDSVTLDIDDMPDVVHGSARCFLPIHINDAATGRPVAMILDPDGRGRASLCGAVFMG